MPTVTLLDGALDAAKRLGYTDPSRMSRRQRRRLRAPRPESSSSSISTSARTSNSKRSLETLRRDPKAAALPMPHQLRWLLRMRRAA